MTRRGMMRSRKGFYGIAVWHPKSEVNVGSLWRSAFLYDAAFIATIGRRYIKQPSDTPNTNSRIPLFHYADIDDLTEHLPYNCPLLGIELTDGAIPLPRLWHPLNAVYLLGAEDHGLPDNVLSRCHQVVQIPTAKDWSMNVAVAGSIVLYDRYTQGLS